MSCFHFDYRMFFFICISLYFFVLWYLSWLLKYCLDRNQRPFSFQTSICIVNALDELQPVYWLDYILFMFLTDMKMPKLAAEIAKQLRKFHQVEIPGSKEPQLWIDIFKFFEKGSFLIN